MTVHDIDMSCPADLEPYSKAFSLEQKNEDAKMWSWWGAYGQSTLMCAIDKILNGRNAKLKYIENPLYEENLDSKKELTEDEIKKQRMLHRLKMETLKANFDLTHPKKEEVQK